MKTTIEIPDALLERARALARARDTTIPNLIEEGLRLVLGRDTPQPHYQIPDCSFEGRGLEESFEGGGWARQRAAIYGEDL